MAVGLGILAVAGDNEEEKGKVVVEVGIGEAGAVGAVAVAEVDGVEGEEDEVAAEGAVAVVVVEEEGTVSYCQHSHPMPVQTQY